MYFMKKILYSTCFLSLGIVLCPILSKKVIAQELKYSVPEENRPHFGKSDGAINLVGKFDTKNKYTITYVRRGYAIDSCVTSPKNETTLVIKGLEAGIYSQVTVKTENSNTIMPGYVELNDISGNYRLARTINPTCEHKNGKIMLDSLESCGRYVATYIKDGNEVFFDNRKCCDDVRGENCIKADAEGNLIIDGVYAGTYTDIAVYEIDAKDKLGRKKLIYPVILTDDYSKCVGTLRTTFMGAAFENFTGIQDDNPNNFLQFYARLSQPLNKAEGISYDALGRDRFVWLRNLMFQLSYGNTDNFKMYTTDFFGRKYVNRLDLYAHSYFTGTLNVNIISYIMPKNWKLHTGDMCHGYLDFFTSLAVTNVHDSGTAVGHSVKEDDMKKYNIKTSIWGLSAKLRFNNVFNTNFMIEVNPRLFWLYPSSKIVDPTLNPQNSDMVGFNDSIFQYKSSSDTTTLNSFKYTGKNVPPHYALDILIQYNTSDKKDNNSNIFLHYNYTSNFTGSGRNFQNNYWQFQIGYSMDITKVFRSKEDNAAAGEKKADLAPTKEEKPAATTDSKTDTTNGKSSSVKGKSDDRTPAAKQEAKCCDSIKIIKFEGTAKSSQTVILRKQPIETADSVGVFKTKSEIPYVGYTNEGQSVNGNSIWYHTKDKEWFWSGGVNKKKVKDKTAKKKDASKKASKKK